MLCVVLVLVLKFMDHWGYRLLLLCMVWLGSVGLCQAQFAYTWEQFEEDYLYNAATTEDNGAIDIDLLRELYANPINLNTAEREDLEQLPFLDDAQISAFLDYRKYNAPMLSLGELMLVWRMDWKTRCYLSLFTYCGVEQAAQRLTWRERLYQGKHEVSSRMDIPLYRRQGQQRTPETSDRAKTQWYLGTPYYHNVKYGYNYKNLVRYGLQMEKDAGEPFAQWGNKGFDAYSLHASYKTEDGKWQVVLGDYRVHTGLGLVAGNGFMLSTKSFVQSRTAVSLRLSPHTSMSEGNYLRGVATMVRLAPRWQLLSYVAMNALDATLDSSGQMTSIATSGQHRTYQELQRKHTAKATTMGVGIQYGYERTWTWGLSANVVHYNKPFAPQKERYQQLRYPEQTHANVGAFYLLTKPRWQVGGELSVDKQGDIAYIQTGQWRMGQTWRTEAIARYYTSGYQAYLAKALRSSGRVQNELGLRLATSGTLLPYITLDTYADVHYHPARSATTPHGAWGSSAGASMNWKASDTWNWQIRYAISTLQRYVAGSSQTLRALHTTQQWRLQAEYMPSSTLSVRSTLGIRGYHSPTKGMSWGIGWSARCNWQTEQWRVATSAAVFSSEDGYTRLSTYEPSLRYTSGYTTLNNKGFRIAIMSEYLWKKWVGVGAKIGWTHYWDIDAIGTGPQQIAGSNKADISLQVRCLW